MNLSSIASSMQKCHISLRLVFLILYAVSFCNMCHGAYSSKPRFVIEFTRSSCGRYIHSRSGSSTTPNDDLLHLWYGSNYYQAEFYFQPIDGKWGYIIHRKSGKVWHPKGGPGKARKEGTKVVLHSDRKRWALWAIDQVSGTIQHRDGYYVHVQHNDCKNGADVHLWPRRYGPWKFVDRYQTSQEVLPYGSFRTSGDWQLCFAVHNPLTDHHYEITHREGQSRTESKTSQFRFKWQMGASAQFWFARVSTSVSLSTEIRKTSSSTWYSETTKTHRITVKKGEPLAVWQKVYTGEQIGNKEVFQSNFFAHTHSRYVKPRSNVRSSIAGLRSEDNVYYYYLNDTNNVDNYQDESNRLNLYEHQENVAADTNHIDHMDSTLKLRGKSQTDNGDTMFDKQQELEKRKVDTSIPMINDTENIQYDDEGVFTLVDTYFIIDHFDAEYDEEKEYNEESDYYENGGHDQFEINEDSRNMDQELNSILNATEYAPLKDNPTESVEIIDAENQQKNDPQHQIEDSTTLETMTLD